MNHKEMYSKRSTIFEKLSNDSFIDSLLIANKHDRIQYNKKYNKNSNKASVRIHKLNYHR